MFFSLPLSTLKGVLFFRIFVEKDEFEKRKKGKRKSCIFRFQEKFCVGIHLLPTFFPVPLSFAT